VVEAAKTTVVEAAQITLLWRLLRPLWWRLSITAVLKAAYCGPVCWKSQDYFPKV